MYLKNKFKDIEVEEQSVRIQTVSASGLVKIIFNQKMMVSNSGANQNRLLQEGDSEALKLAELLKFKDMIEVDVIPD